MRLRSKLTLTLLGISLFSVALVGGIAYWLLMKGFSQEVMVRSFANFEQDVVRYLRTYGDWATAQRSEPFTDFVMRLRHPPGTPAEKPPFPEAGSLRPLPPFYFTLADAEGKVLLSPPPFTVGEKLPGDLLRSALPITMDGRLVAQAIPFGTPNLAPQDKRYLGAMREALLWGVLGAGTLATLLGLWFGRRMCGALEALTSAIHKLPVDEELATPLSIRSQDEIGDLAVAFNGMSLKLSEAHRELRKLSTHDPLTNLHNRRYFDTQSAQIYEQARRYNRPLTVVVGDLDHFKQINDRFSHAAGDAVLRRIANLLRTLSRKSDIVARFGGEEFVILMPETDEIAAYCNCEKLRTAIEETVWDDIAPGLTVTISMGLCGDTALGGIEPMLGIADSFLYAAKEGGRNKVAPIPPGDSCGASLTQ